MAVDLDRDGNRVQVAMSTVPGQRYRVAINGCEIKELTYVEIKHGGPGELIEVTVKLWAASVTGFGEEPEPRQRRGIDI